VPKRRNDSLNPELVKRLVRAIRKHPNLTDAADACGVNPRDLALWIKKGLYPNAPAGCAALAVAARRARALLRGRLFDTLIVAATHRIDPSTGEPIPGDPKWASYIMERLDEEGEIKWQDTIPSGPDMPDVRRHLIQSGAMDKEIADAGFKLVPLEPGDSPTLQIAEGEFADDDA